MSRIKMNRHLPKKKLFSLPSLILLAFIVIISISIFLFFEKRNVLLPDSEQQLLQQQWVGDGHENDLKKKTNTRKLTQVGSDEETTTTTITDETKKRRLLQQKQQQIDDDDNEDEDKNNEEEEEEQDEDETIPHKLWFTYKSNILETKEPMDYYNNIVNTIEKYNQFWENQEDKKTNKKKKSARVKVNFLTDQMCRGKINMVEPDLLPYYDQLMRLDEYNNNNQGGSGGAIGIDNGIGGPLRADICRIAVLYLHGGYFFDIDIEVIEPFVPNPSSPRRIQILSTSGCSGNCIRQEFIASVPNHIMLKQSLELLLYEYNVNGINPTHYIRPMSFALGRAYHNLSRSQRIRNVHLLQELELDFNTFEGGGTGKNSKNKRYPTLQRQYGQGHGCNFVNHDLNAQRVYFYRHFLGSINCQRGIIPHELWFTNGNNVLVDLYPRGIYINVVKTIRTYREFWKNDEAPIHFLDNEDCRFVIQNEFPKLLKYYDTEVAGSYKGDICRNVAIYKTGGYYFDVDMDVVTPVQPKRVDTTFITTVACGGGCFFNAFFACTSNHPIVMGSLQYMLNIYETNDDNVMLGPRTMFMAWHDIEKDIQKQKMQKNNKNNNKKKNNNTEGEQQVEEQRVELYQELKLDIGNIVEHYPNVKRQPDNGNCNYVVHDPNEQIIYFFARFVGYGGCQPINAFQ